MSAASDEDPADGVTSSQKRNRAKVQKTKGPDDPNSASQVVRRHLSATSPSPLYQ